MSYFQKGQNALLNRIIALEGYVYGLHPIPVPYHVYQNCDTTSCSGPAGYPKAITQLNIKQSELPSQPESILVNFEWTNELEETFNWCCCFAYKSSGEGDPSIESPDIISIVQDEPCTSDDCEECHEIICEFQCDEIPAQTPTFTTGLVGDVDFTQSDSFNDSWNGMIVDIIDINACEVAVSLTGPLGGGSPLVTTVTLDFDTEYGIYIKSPGTFPAEASLVVEQDGSTLLTQDPFPPAGPGMGECDWLQNPL